MAAIAYHFGEGLVRTRFMEYVSRFVRLAARYEEDTYGMTKLSYPSVSFSLGMPSQLGSGILFGDEVTCVRELSSNASRIEGWRKTNSYQHCMAVCCLFNTATLLRFPFNNAARSLLYYRISENIKLPKLSRGLTSFISFSGCDIRRICRMPR
jgi:hypothetical protein